MIAAWTALSLSLAFAADGAAEGDHLVRIHVRGLPANYELEARRGDERPIHLVDNGTGVLTGDLHGPPARFLTLELIELAPNGVRTSLYDGLVVLTDPAHDVVAFHYQERQLLRVPVAPSARLEIALDQRATWWVSFGWAAISAVWLGVLGVMWALRSR